MVGNIVGVCLTVFFAVMVHKVKLTQEQDDLLDRWEALNDRFAELENKLRREDD